MSKSMTKSNGSATQEKDTNIQVVVRCRESPLRTTTSSSSIVVHPVFGQDVKIDGPSSIARSYQYDGVFGPKATQEHIYDKIVSPILNEVLLGYNCTIFAYGQTGTGKTYTMEGDLESGSPGNAPVISTPMTSRTQPPMFATAAAAAALGTNSARISSKAGIIPRTLYNLFYALDKQSAEYYVRVSYVELYNEELRDLLANNTAADNAHGRVFGGGFESSNGHLKVYDSGAEKGVIIQGLEEKIVGSAKEAMGFMQSGSIRRKVAATRCNDSSSRSHAIFTISVFIHERAVTAEGEDIVKIGKLNLVDLAGSENIGRSGAQDMRAREAGNINKSLLVLGRVINALVERNSYVPYRDSKLTYIIKDALGGRTRTCMIATISDTVTNIEETIKTLQYASQAKGIRNRPVANKRVSKSEIVHDMQHQIDQLKKDLEAARDSTGFFMAKDSYDELMLEVKTSREKSNDWKLRVDILEEQIEKLGREHAELEQHHKATRIALADSEQMLDRARVAFAVAQKQLDDQRVLTRAHALHENSLDTAARELYNTLAAADTDAQQLQQKISRMGDRERRNLRAAKNIEQKVRDETTRALAAVKGHSERAGEQTAQLLDTLRSRVGDEFEASVAEAVRQHVDALNTELATIAGGAEARGSQISEACEKTLVAFGSLVGSLAEGTHEASAKCAVACAEYMTSVGSTLKQQDEAMAAMSTSVLQLIEAGRDEAAAKQRESQSLTAQIIEDLTRHAAALTRKHAAEVGALQTKVSALAGQAQDADARLVQSIQAMLVERRELEAEAMAEMLQTAKAQAEENTTGATAVLEQSTGISRQAGQLADSLTTRISQIHGDIGASMDAALSDSAARSASFGSLAVTHADGMQMAVDATMASVSNVRSDSAALVADMRKGLAGMYEVADSAIGQGTQVSTVAVQRVSEVTGSALDSWRTARTELDGLAQTQSSELQEVATELGRGITAIADVVSHESSAGIAPTVCGGSTPPRRKYESVNQWNVTRDHDYILAKLTELERSDQIDQIDQQPREQLGWTGITVAPGAPISLAPMDIGSEDSDDMQMAGGDTNTPVSAISVQTLVSPESTTKSMLKRPSENIASPMTDSEMQQPPTRRPRTLSSRHSGSVLSVDGEDVQADAVMEAAASAIPLPVSRLQAPRRQRRTRN
ncbi:Kinesin- motor protein [Kickxella alabastrina]|uniref:Kinesin- motor protein n=1 Tax=Kickxella alabastrina TaxID=61397 RepID=A0ACC1ISZ2_9FUNG|nr:Kinesin- motor protein [Kickxella alabastrina]